MLKQADVRIEHDMLAVSGDLDFNNVMSVYQKSLKAFATRNSNIIIDFAELRSANSAALAIIINWMSLAKKTDKTIQLKNLSNDVLSLAKASGLDKIMAPLMV
jgi:anti-anti-sigma factor